MSSRQAEDLKFSYSMVIECMMEPLRKRFRSHLDKIDSNQLVADAQTVEAINGMITATSQVPSTDIHLSEKDWDQMIVTFVRDVCLCILSSLHVFPDSTKGNSERLKTRSVILHAVSSCIGYIKEKDTLLKIVFQMFAPLYSLNKSNQDPPHILKDSAVEFSSSNNLDLITALELFTIFLHDEATMDTFLSNATQYNLDPDTELKHFFCSLMLALETDNSSFSKVLNAISKLLNICSASLQRDLLAEVWHRFTQPLKRDLNGNIEKGPLWQSLYAFYRLKDLFFPLEKDQQTVLAQHLGDQFWTCIQAGILSSEPSHRKLSMYLLKRLIDTCHQNGCNVNDHWTYDNGQDETEKLKKLEPMFWWDKEQSRILSDVWEDFILLMETLEEKQVHVIKPVLSRMIKLISLFSTPSSQGLSFLHTSWLMIIFVRCFHHESHFLSRWGAETLLTLDFQQIPLTKHGQMKFLSQDLLGYLQENKLYARYNDTELGSCSPVGGALGHFFAKLFASINRNEKVEYLTNTLQEILDHTWGSVPMVFLSQGLSNIPSEPLLGKENMLKIRDILHTCSSTHEQQARATTQCFFGQMIINLVDLNSLGILDFFTTLSGLNRDESFKRGTNLSEKFVRFLQEDKVRSRWDDKQILSIALEFLAERKDKEETNTVVFDGFKVVGISRMLLLFGDAYFSSLSMTREGDLCQEKTLMEKCPLGIVLNEILSIMANIRSRSYIMVSRVDACLAVMQCLGKEIGDVSNADPVGMFVSAKLSQTFEHAASFVIRRLSQDLTKPQDLDEVKFYTDVILTLGIHSTSPLTPLTELLTFVTGAFSLTSQQPANAEVDMICTSAMKILYKVLKITHQNNAMSNEGKDLVQKKLSAMKSIHSLPLPFSKGIVSSEESFSKAQVGYVIGSFLSSKWHSYELMFLLGYESLNAEDNMKFVLESSMEALTLGSGSSDVAVFNVLELIIEKILLHIPSMVPALLELGWAKVIEERKNVLFRRKLEALIPVALHRSLLEPNVNDDVATAVGQLTEKIFTMGQEKSGVIYMAVKHLCEEGLELDMGRGRATRMIPTLLQACDFGTIHKKWQKWWLDIIAYIEGLGPALASNQIIDSIEKNDISTRIAVLNWLSGLKPTVPADHEFAMTFLRALCDRYLEYAENTSYKHFSNSLSHRQKHRMILVFILLSDFIKEEDCEEFLSKLKTGLELECHPSVTHTLEWIMMRLLIRYPSFMPRLWDSISEFVQRRSVCLCSLFLIISHIGPRLPETLQLDFYKQAFHTLMPWTMAHHYMTRIFAQTCVCKLWEQYSTLNLGQSSGEKLDLIKATVDFLSNNSNASNTVAKLQDNFMVSSFDPVRDFSAETIFYTLPRLATIADDEWISPQQLLHQDITWQEGRKLLPLFNASQQLSGCKEGPWKIKTHVENEDDTTKKMHGDVQKKIMPWRQMAPDDDTENELVVERRRQGKDGLILVSSLIDKIPNLGGLCRTSEIFGVSEFVIGNLVFLEDKMFQSLSVSSQKWLPITEVPSPKLSDYLVEKRREGYALVGVEQTANSVPLDKYVFPAKSLLVLGNEKEGIPPDMIQTLDVCVEIPQHGVIRSLNVHVCGALIVWEYTRQHMENQH